MKRKRFIKLLMASGEYDRDHAVQQAVHIQYLKQSYSSAFEQLNRWNEMVCRMNMECECLRENVAERLEELFSSNYLGKRFLSVSNVDTEKDGA